LTGLVTGWYHPPAPGPRRERPDAFRRSSVVARAAVNRLVVGANPTAGATFNPDVAIPPPSDPRHGLPLQQERVMPENSQPSTSTERVALVTGGASGIGRATVDRLVAEGLTVVIADIQDEAGEAA